MLLSASVRYSLVPLSHCWITEEEWDNKEWLKLGWRKHNVRGSQSQRGSFIFLHPKISKATGQTGSLFFYTLIPSGDVYHCVRIRLLLQQDATLCGINNTNLFSYISRCCESTTGQHHHIPSPGSRRYSVFLSPKLLAAAWMYGFMTQHNFHLFPSSRLPLSS